MLPALAMGTAACAVVRHAHTDRQLHYPPSRTPPTPPTCVQSGFLRPTQLRYDVTQLIALEYRRQLGIKKEQREADVRATKEAAAKAAAAAAANGAVAAAVADGPAPGFRYRSQQVPGRDMTARSVARRPAQQLSRGSHWLPAPCLLPRLSS